MSHTDHKILNIKILCRQILFIFCPILLMTAQTRLAMSENDSIKFSKLYQEGKIKEAGIFLESVYTPLKTKTTNELISFDTYYYLHLADIARNEIKINGQTLDPETRKDGSIREDLASVGAESQFYGLKPLYLVANPQDGRIISYFDHPIVRKLKQQQIDTQKRKEETSKEIRESKSIFGAVGSLLKGTVKGIGYALKDAAVNVVDALTKDLPVFPGKYYELAAASMNYTLNLALLNDYEQAAITANSLSKIYEEIGGKLSREQVDYRESFATNTNQSDAYQMNTEARENIEFGIDESGKSLSSSFTGGETPEEFAAKFKIDGTSTTYLDELKKFRNEDSLAISNSYELASAYLVSGFVTSHISKNQQSLDEPLVKDSTIAQEDVEASLKKGSDFIQKLRRLRRANADLDRLQTDPDFMSAIVNQDKEKTNTVNTLVIVETGSISNIDTAKITIPYYNKTTKMGGAVTIKLPRISQQAQIFDVTSLDISTIKKPENTMQNAQSKVTVSKKTSKVPIADPGKTIALYEVDNLDLMLKKQLSDEMPSRILEAATSVWLQYEFQKLAYKKIEESKNNETNKTILKLLATGVTYAISSGDLDTAMWRTLPSKIFMNQVQLNAGENSLSLKTPAGLKTVKINLDKKADIIHIRVFPNGMVVKTGNHQEFVMADDANSFIGKGEFGSALERVKQ